MILNTGMRTDIPAYFSKWFLNRIREGYVLTRNPYNPLQVTRYRLDPEVVDILCFGTKNPGPLLPHLDEIGKFRTFWFVSQTPTGGSSSRMSRTGKSGGIYQGALPGVWAEGGVLEGLSDNCQRQVYGPLAH